MQSRFLWFAAVMIGIVAPCAAYRLGDGSTPVPKYTIKLDRPWHVGQTDHYQGHFKHVQKQVVTQNGSVVHDITDFREFVCEVRERVVQVSGKGRPTQTRVHFIAFRGRFSSQGELNPLPLQGATVLVTLLPKATFQRSDGRKLDKDDLAFLNQLYAGSSAGSPTGNDDALDPPGPVAVGETWKGDAAVTAGQMTQGSSSKTAVSPSDVASNFTLAEKRTVNGVDCLVVNGSIDMDHFVIPGLDGASGKAHTTLSKTVPVDPAKQEQAVVVDAEATIKGAIPTPDGRQELTITTTDHQETLHLGQAQ